MNPKSDQVYKLVQSMKLRNVPIDGVGLQFHWSLQNHPDLQSVAANMTRLGSPPPRLQCMCVSHVCCGCTNEEECHGPAARAGALGLEVHITELDIKCVPKGSEKPCTPQMLNAQAKLYADILMACINAPSCKSFESWGFTDKHTWIGTATHPLPFDENYKAKPAVFAMINAMLAVNSTNATVVGSLA
jgi:endo-1,4-beta-xylanase